MIKQQIYLMLLLAICFSCDKNNQVNNTIILKQLSVNSKENPTTIESEQPLFSWNVDAKGYNKSQSAYQILVAASQDKLNENDADLWNSEKVKSDKSLLVKYQEIFFKALKTYGHDKNNH